MSGCRFRRDAKPQFAERRLHVRRRRFRDGEGGGGDFLLEPEQEPLHARLRQVAAQLIEDRLSFEDLVPRRQRRPPARREPHVFVELLGAVRLAVEQHVHERPRLRVERGAPRPFVVERRIDVDGEQLIERQQAFGVEPHQVRGDDAAQQRRASVVAYFEGAVILGESFRQPCRRVPEEIGGHQVAVFVIDRPQ